MNIHDAAAEEKGMFFLKHQKTLLPPCVTHNFEVVEMFYVFERVFETETA